MEVEASKKTHPTNPYTRWLKCNICGTPVPDIGGVEDPETVQCDRHDGSIITKNSSSKPRVIGPCTGRSCGHCRYLTETLKELKKKPVTGSIPFEDVETAENLKKVLSLHKQGRNL